MLDVLLGTLATFFGRCGGRYALRGKGPVAALIPPVVVFNALLVPLVLMWCDGQGYWLSALSIAISEAISCYAGWACRRKRWLRGLPTSCKEAKTQREMSGHDGY